MSNTHKLSTLLFTCFLFVVIWCFVALIVKSNEKFDSIEEKLDTICKVDKAECERQLTLLLLL